MTNSYKPAPGITITSWTSGDGTTACTWACPGTMTYNAAQNTCINACPLGGIRYVGDDIELRDCDGVKRYVMRNRNVGATVAGTGNINSYGYLFQRGNNY